MAVRSGDNARAALMTRGLHEMKRLGMRLGASQDTFSGLAGMGDLIVTCTSEHSRNRYVGYNIGQGKTLDETISQMNMVAEGVKTTRSVREWSNKLDVEMPITDAVYHVLFEDEDPKDMLYDLMTRNPKEEIIDLGRASSQSWRRMRCSESDISSRICSSELNILIVPSLRTKKDPVAMYSDNQHSASLSQMDYLDVKNLAQTGEGAFLEFKRTIPSAYKIAREIAAFANTKGGTLLIGVDDDKSLVGVMGYQEEEFLLAKAARELCRPAVDITIEIVYFGERDLLVIRVLRSSGQAYFCERGGR
ncbi:MAG: NAD(P)H-dependent glycerol-3-phosphate dehydrogenase [Fodinibius sp.]|nr:NAD(P)H-dependent glycerol-3-phosphate dehydrogenase [Fodinibius sp.]